MADPVVRKQEYVAGVIPLPLSQSAEISLVALYVILAAGAMYAAYRATTAYSLGLAYKGFTATAVVLLSSSFSALYIAIRSNDCRYNNLSMDDRDPPPRKRRSRKKQDPKIDEKERRRLETIEKARRRLAQRENPLIKRNQELLETIKNLPILPQEQEAPIDDLEDTTTQQAQNEKKISDLTKIQTLSGIKREEQAENQNSLNHLLNESKRLIEEMDRIRNGCEPTLHLVLKPRIDLPEAIQCLKNAAKQGGQAVIDELYDILMRNMDRYAKEDIIELFTKASTVCEFAEDDAAALELWKNIALIGFDEEDYWDWACAFKESVIQLAEYQSKPIYQQIFLACRRALTERIEAIGEDCEKAQEERQLRKRHLQLFELQHHSRSHNISMIASGESLFALRFL